MKKNRLKSQRATEARKIDYAVKYDRKDKATNGGEVNPKRIRHKLEARFIPPTPSPTTTKKTKKPKKPLRH